jgi:hypothetical protein
MVRIWAMAVLLMSGCSFALVKGPPKQAPMRRDRMAFCTNSAGMPMLVDVALAVITTPLAIAAGAGAGSYVYGQSDSMEPAKAASTGIAVGAVAMTVPVTAAISAIWGYRTSNRCSSYQLEYAAQRRGVDVDVDVTAHE